MKLTNKRLFQLIKEELEKFTEEIDHEDELMDELFPEELSESLLLAGGALGAAIATAIAYVSGYFIDVPKSYIFGDKFEVSLDRFLNTVPDRVRQRLGQAADEAQEEEAAILLTAFEQDEEMLSQIQQYMDLNSEIERLKQSSSNLELQNNLLKQRRQLAKVLNNKIDQLSRRKF